MENRERFIINGGKPLEGEIDVRGAKNSAFSILAAALLTKQDCVVSNLPLIEDVFRMLEIMKSMDVDINWLGKRTIKINAKNLDPSKIKKDLVLLFRGSVLLYGPLLARFGKVKLPCPGGCIIGARPLTTHFDAFSQLGVQVMPQGNSFELRINSNEIEPRLSNVILNEFSVTATENIMLFAGLLPQTTVIKIADTDYQVQELAKFLKKMGVKIKGARNHTITIQGSKKLRGANQSLIYDPIEAGTFILMAAANRAKLVIKNVELPFLEFPLKKLRDFGVSCEIVQKSCAGRGAIKVLPWKRLKIDKIQSLPYPGIPSDLQSAFGVLATQAEGSTLIHDPLYEGRLKYLEELNKMGAKIIFADPHRAVVNGPSRLFGMELGSFDLRGGAALIIAGLLAKGKTLINNIYQVDRGYERIEERLQKIGADIRRIQS
jgi:UDP-N-acetylglucosamine 1-carboxyvinyltransferase